MNGHSSMRAIPRFLTALRRNVSGLALIEFALGLPILLGMSLPGAELTNYVTVRMRVSQLALSLADNAARMGEGDPLAAKRISETDINDVLTGAGLQSSDLNLYKNGRVIISSLQTVPGPDKYMIVWQRCRGEKVQFPSPYKEDKKYPYGIGPPNQKVTATRRGATMFVDVNYEYTPLISDSLAPNLIMREIASMDVRDRRDLSDDSYRGSAATHPDGIYNNEDATPSTC